jgi:hypothetical protein
MTEIKFDRIAGMEEIEQRKRQSSAELLREEQARYEPAIQKLRKKEIDAKLLAYLRLIKENPGMAATERDKKFNVLPKYGSAYRKQLKESGMIEETNITDARGKYFKEIRITAAGLAMLS